MKVTANVLLRDPQTGVVTVINAGEEAPEWAEPLLGSHVVESKAGSKVSGETDGNVEAKAEPKVEAEPKKTARRSRR